MLGLGKLTINLKVLGVNLYLIADRICDGDTVFNSSAALCPTDHSSASCLNLDMFRLHSF